MNSIAHHALRRFSDHADNPMVQALTWFITTNLHRQLADVESWGIEVSDKKSRTFYLRFMDGHRMEGTLHEVWQVAIFKDEVKND